MDALVACLLLKNAEPNATDIASLVSTCKTDFPAQLMDEACNAALQIYKKAGGDDKAAKSQSIRDNLVAALNTMFPALPQRRAS